MAAACPFCTSTRLISSSDPLHWRQGDYKMLSCESCGTVTAWPREAATDEVYDHGMPSDRWEFDEVIKDCTQDISKRRLLDVGCGKGDFLILAASAGLTVSGIDFSSENIEHARSRGAECHQGDLRDFEVHRRFHVITAFHVIEHLSDPQAFLETLKDRIEEDGVVYLSFPNVHRGTLRFMRDFGDFPPYHLNRISDLGIARLAERVGLRVSDCRIEPRDVHWRYATSLSVNQALDRPRLRQAIESSRLLNFGLKAFVAVVLQPAILWRLMRYQSDPGFTVLYRLERMG